MNSRLEAHKQELYEIRFSTMCKPAAEVANLTNLESQTTRARSLMLWRIAAGYLSWQPRQVEIVYQTTLDSISEAFDIFHYPVSRHLLDVRADVWEAGLAPQCVRQAVDAGLHEPAGEASGKSDSGTLLLAGELAHLEGQAGLNSLLDSLHRAAGDIAAWRVDCGAVAYILGARQEARQQAERVLEGIRKSQAATVLADGPETAWALLKLYPEMGLAVPENVRVKLLSEYLLEMNCAAKAIPEPVFVHDSRPAYFIADQQPSHLAILPSTVEDESVFGSGAVYEAPRQLLESISLRRVKGIWNRGLAKSCGADDGLWLTYPELAAGLARQRLDYILGLGAAAIVTDSPLCASFLAANRSESDAQVFWLPELLVMKEAAK